MSQQNIEEIEIMVGTTAVRWVFKPVYNGTVTKIYWVIDYTIDYSLAINPAYDAGEVKYAIYNNYTSTWDTLSNDGHFWFHTNTANEAFFGHLCPQVFYGEVTTNPSYYINDEGKVEVKMYFNFATTLRESEIHWDGSAIQQYIARKTRMLIYYNGLYVET